MEYLNEKNAMKTISLIKTAGKLLDERIHLVACSGLYQYQEHGNCDILNALVHAMPKSARTNNLRHWITEHANVEWDAKAGKDKTGGYKKANQTDSRKVTLDEAVAKPFYEKVDSNPVDFNLDQRAKSFLSTVKKQFEAGKVSFADAHKVKEEFDTLFAGIFAKEAEQAAQTIQ